ncbi:MAG TPA: hypothetical protein VMU11_00615 [Verrucomicrobiae bacterium]|nr:hypothetical protein [Verrucomicrobiae bacterium]
MSNFCTECANCGNPTPTDNLDADGHCARCSTGRVSAPPPIAPATNVAKTERKSFHTGKLDRAPIASKIPLAQHLQRLQLRDPQIPGPPLVPREAEPST